MILFCNKLSNKKIHIKENKLHLLKESLSTNVYHFTSIFAVLDILNSNEMFCQSAKVGGGADDYSNKYDFYISMTRAKTSQEGYGYVSAKNTIARIEFDGDKLSHNFHGEPINYWGGSESLTNKFSYMRHAQNSKYFEYKEITDTNEISKHDFEPLPPFTYIYSNGSSSSVSEDAPEYVEKDGKYYKKVQLISPEIQHHRDNEIEDRLFTNKPIIDHIRDYIKRVDIFVNETNEVYENVLAVLTQLATKFSSIVFIYDNKRDFDNQTENTINQKYIDLWGKYGHLTPTRFKNGVDVDFLCYICSLATFLDDNAVVNKNKALLLKKYGLDKYTSQVLRKRDNFYGLQGLIDNIMSSSQNASKSPTKEGQIALKMLNDFLKNRGYKSLRDAYKKMTEELESRRRGGYDWSSIDTTNQKTIKILEHDGHRYIINNDADTDFWTVFDLDRKSYRYNFIDDVIYNLENGYWSETYKSVIRDGSLFTFKKYLQNLAHKKVTLSKMFSLFERLGVEPTEAINETIGNFRIYEIEGNYWEISNKYLLPPFKHNGDFDEYIRELFKKEA